MRSRSMVCNPVGELVAGMRASSPRPKPLLRSRNPRRYRSVSAFSPISNPTDAPWGKKAFSHYLGSDVKSWRDYDATFLIKAGDRAEYLPMLIDQGDADEFLAEQLKPERLIDACESANYPVQFNMRAGYDHSYFFISTFIESHLRFHAGALSA